MRLNKTVAFLSIFTLLSFIGCAGGESDGTPDLGKVTGTVTMDGTPLANVTVTFNSSDGQASFGTTDSEGKYELTYRGDAKGAKVGDHKVTIETPLEAPPEPGYKDPIPAKYNSKTTLTAVVKAGDNTIDFKLTK